MIIGFKTGIQVRFLLRGIFFFSRTFRYRLVDINVTTSENKKRRVSTENIVYSNKEHARVNACRRVCVDECTLIFMRVFQVRWH